MNELDFLYKKIYHFFETHKEGKFDSSDICADLMKRYRFASKEQRHGSNFKRPLLKDVSSRLKHFYTKPHLVSLRNFERYEDNGRYIYYYKARTTNHILPDNSDVTEQTEQYTLPLEQFKAMDKTDDNKAELEEIASFMNKHKIHDLTYTKNVDNRKIIINITN